MSLLSLQTNATADGTPADMLLLQLVPKLDNTYGATLLGTFLSLILFGISLNQVYRYFVIHSNDTWSRKGYVCSLVVMDTLHTVVYTHWCYNRLVVNYLNPLVLLSTDIWSLRALCMVTAITIFACQAFLAHRIYKVDKRYRLFIWFIAVLLLGELAFAGVATYKASVVLNFYAFEKWTWCITAAFGIGMVVDCSLTTILIIFLRGKRSDFEGTNSLLDKLTAYTMATGLITTIFAILTVVFSTVYPENMIYIGIDAILTKLWTNSILAA
ncbi:hypothetical protein C8Q74DRAFT_1366976 [Fomes fomentarius]|nr:hypothetical protein C8Q74DRAFT_1366976 [Fomes fomentarius]